MYRFFFKRIIDIVISFFVLLVFLPIILFLILFLTFANDGKPFFIQKRPGRNEKIFKILKFKTMNDKRDIHGNLLSDADRLTKVGRFVRKTSLDELPQLINVLKGDMSLIGPRPLLPEYLPLYNEFQKKRHNVKPGITGWAQVNGRNSISWKEKFELDVYYVDKISFILDFSIIFLTIKRVFKSDGISQVGQATMENFKGN